MIRLSICIPSYNRASLLKETLESIIFQATDEVEITVSDNGSSDDTTAVVNHYQMLFPRLRYFRFDSNQGADKNYLQCVAIATGEYCWLMGSDDRLEPGAIEGVLKALKENPDLAGMSVNCVSYDISFSQKVPNGALFSCAEDKQITGFAEFFPFPAIYTGYLSGQIVKRALWEEVVETHPVQKFFNAYSLVYIIFHMVKKCPRWLYLKARHVGNRTGNDSFLDRGAFCRLQLDLVGYQEILLTLFHAGEPAYLTTMDAVGILHTKGQLLRACLVDVEKGFWKKAFVLCSRFYAKRSLFWTHLLPFFLIPSCVWKMARFVYRKTWKKLRIQRLQS